MRETVVKTIKRTPEVGDFVYYWAGCAGAEIHDKIMDITSDGKILTWKMFHDGYGSGYHRVYPRDYFRWSEKNNGWLFYWYSNFEGWWPHVDWVLDGTALGLRR